MNQQNLMHKELVSTVIEKTLLKIGLQVYCKITEILRNECHCDIQDCDENPECLRYALEKIFGKAKYSIIQEINKDLSKSTRNYIIDRFITVLNE